ncbi:hypothetical protein [Methyloversatilis sp. XJ19-49]|uniref:hypothetical protein n=1 Tax=Methyloversatilis sp. XJ19-49 TaxID=2963429 RepID=UPI00211C6316|nr:hypothetical protein [Methyloversatilis sp. XJ19-49]MCQ9378832.1 hypothetical protein [Methyloversatilis sp. XJ19-49]
MDYVSLAPINSAQSAWIQYAPYEPPRLKNHEVLSTGTGASKKFELFELKEGPTAPTMFVADKDSKTAAGQATKAEVSIKVKSQESNNQKSFFEASDVTIVARQRVKLMAARYVLDHESVEVLARLEILNRKLIEKAPRVSADQVAALEAAHDTLAQVKAKKDARAARFGISA